MLFCFVLLIHVCVTLLLQMGDPSTEVTEENQEAAQVSKAKAIEAIAAGNLFHGISCS